MRLQGIDIFRSDFRFNILDGGTTFFVTYNDDDVTVSCGCPRGKQCEHTVFIHEVLNKETDYSLLRFIEGTRVGNSKPIYWDTVSRIRGAFAREYNLANGVVQYPDTSPRGPRGPLGWEGPVPGANKPMRVLERTTAAFTVYEVGSDTWKLVVGISDPTCQAGKCRRGCKHEKAVIEALREWRARGWIPNTDRGLSDNKSATKPVTLTYDDLKMVERVEPYSRSFSPGANLATQEMRVIWKSLTDNTLGGLWDATTQTKFEEDIKKAKELLEKKEKPAKPPKPRTRFTDLEL